MVINVHITMEVIEQWRPVAKRIFSLQRLENNIILWKIEGNIWPHEVSNIAVTELNHPSSSFV